MSDSINPLDTVLIPPLGVGDLPIKWQSDSLDVLVALGPTESYSRYHTTVAQIVPHCVAVLNRFREPAREWNLETNGWNIATN